MALAGVVQKYQNKSASASHERSHGLTALRVMWQRKAMLSPRGRCQMRISGRVANRASMFDINS
jgi:hypothetical protein